MQLCSFVQLQLRPRWCSGCCWPSARPKAIAGGFPGLRGDTEAGTVLTLSEEEGKEEGGRGGGRGKGGKGNLTTIALSCRSVPHIVALSIVSIVLMLSMHCPALTCSDQEWIAIWKVCCSCYQLYQQHLVSLPFQLYQCLQCTHLQFPALTCID